MSVCVVVASDARQGTCVVYLVSCAWKACIPSFAWSAHAVSARRFVFREES